MEGKEGRVGRTLVGVERITDPERLAERLDHGHLGAGSDAGQRQVGAEADDAESDQHHHPVGQGARRAGDHRGYQELANHQRDRQREPGDEEP